MKTRGEDPQDTPAAASGPSSLLPLDRGSLLESIGGVVWEADPQTFRFRFVSRQAEALLGYPLEAWFTEGFWAEHIHPNDRGWAAAYCRRAVADQRDHDFEYRMIAADGRSVWVRDLVTVVSEDDRAVSLRGVIIDVSKRREVEEALRVTDARLRMLVDHAPVILFALDREGIVRQCEGRGLAAAGVQPYEVVGVSYLDLYPDTPRIRENLGRALSGEEFADRVEFRRRVFEVRYVPMWSDRREVEGVVGVASDITESVQIEAKRLDDETREQERRRLESLGVLAGGIAHDFNNLLMTILGNVELTSRELPSHAPARRRLERVRAAARNASELTRQLMLYSGAGTQDVRPLDLSELVRSISELLEVSVSDGMQVRYELDPAPLPIAADASQLTRIVLNLVMNAAESLDPDGGEVWVRTRTLEVGSTPLGGIWFGSPTGRGRHVVLEVEDTGHGMDEETRSRIFEPFFTTRFSGRGLGLATVLSLVRAHGGAVRVESEPGRGSRFLVLFPPSEAPAKDAVRAGRRAGLLSSPGGVVVVVDDEPDVRELTEQMLSELGFEPIGASCGREGLERVRAQGDAVVAVLIDLAMPDMGGEETLRALRELRPQLPAILVSGFGAEYAATRVGPALHSGFLQKPFDLQELQATLLGALSPDRTQPAPRLHLQV
jgi:PAS domain S-box-containing protein